MAQTNSNKRAETELVLAASIQRLLDKTVHATCPTHPFRVSHGSVGMLSCLCRGADDTSPACDC